MFIIVSILLSASLIAAIYYMDERYLYISVALILLLSIIQSIQEKKHAISKLKNRPKRKSISNGKKKK